MSIFSQSLNFELEISQAQDTIDRLSREREDGTLAVINNEPDASKRLSQIEMDLADAHAKVETWTRAKIAKDRQEAQKTAASKAALRKSLVLSASKHLDLAASAAADLETHIASASAAYALMQEHAKKAQGVVQIHPVEWPPGTAAEIGDAALERIVAAEMYRSAQQGVDSFFIAVGNCLPGAAPIEGQKDNPTLPPRLGQAVGERAATLKALLKAKLPK